MSKWAKKGAAPLMCGLFTLILFRFVLFIGYVPSASMEPAIHAESYILGCRIIGEPRNGDVIMFRHGGDILVKRIAAVSGDIVYIDDTRLTLSVNEELDGATRVLKVPAGCYFMLGDNSEHSIDSRFWQDPFIQLDQVLAIVWLTNLSLFMMW